MTSDSERSAHPSSSERSSAGPGPSAGPPAVGKASRLESALRSRRRDGGAAFIPYLTHGFPSPAATPRLLALLAETGADVIELGVPFSDPLADGPTIQRAGWRALERGATLGGTLEVLAAAAADLPPVVLFSYLNPILRMGAERFVEGAVEAGAAGVLVTDLPSGGHPGLERLLGGHPDLDLIPLVAPTTPPTRLERIAGRASGFLYYVARLGVTGAREELEEDLAERVDRLRDRVRLPVAVGFGISRPRHARAVARVADGVVVGSALIRALEDGEGPFEELARALAEAAHRP